MPPHEQRVVDEKIELDAKLYKLGQFMKGAIFEILHEAEQQRLTKQAEIMKAYSGILGERIAAFPK